jgi:hypothetical protein
MRGRIVWFVGEAKKESKRFFFEKKKQKTFTTFAPSVQAILPAPGKPKS